MCNQVVSFVSSCCRPVCTSSVWSAGCLFMNEFSETMRLALAFLLLDRDPGSLQSYFKFFYEAILKLFWWFFKSFLNAIKNLNFPIPMCLYKLDCCIIFNSFSSLFWNIFLVPLKNYFFGIFKFFTTDHSNWWFTLCNILKIHIWSQKYHILTCFPTLCIDNFNLLCSILHYFWNQILFQFF